MKSFSTRHFQKLKVPVKKLQFLLCGFIIFKYSNSSSMQGTPLRTQKVSQLPNTFLPKADFGLSSVPYVARFKNICVTHRVVPTLVPNHSYGKKELIQKKKISVHFSQYCPAQLKKRIVNSAPSDFTYIGFDLEEILCNYSVTWITGPTVHLTLKSNFAHFFMDTYWRFFVLLSHLSKFGIQGIDTVFISPLLDVAKNDLHRHNFRELNMNQQLYGPIKKVNHFSFAALRIALSLHEKLVGRSPSVHFHNYSSERSSKKYMYCFEDLWSVSPLRSEDIRNMYLDGVLKKSPLILKDPFHGDYGVKKLLQNFRNELTRVFDIELQQEPLKCIKSVLIYTREDAGQRILPSENLRMIQRILSQNTNLDVTVISHLNGLSFIEQVELFRKTDFLITPHGSSSLNQLFMPVGSIVFESMPSCFEISITHKTGISKSLEHHFKFIESLECKNRSLDSICQYSRDGRMPNVPGRGWKSFSASKGHQRCPTVSFNKRIFSSEIEKLTRQKLFC